MTRPAPAREVLLDAAERLFAEHGIADVSDRRVAEAAGQKNHSAVRYHFGDREGLLRALIERHLASLRDERVRLLEASESLLGDVRSLVLPVTSALAALPAPSWRARFMARAHYQAGIAELTQIGLGLGRLEREAGRSILARLHHLTPAIAHGRLTIMTGMVIMTCADVERATACDGTDPHWAGVGMFLADAITGMLQAPSSLASDYPETAPETAPGPATRGVVPAPG
ncbi:TetR/AcrR family transcriptional regulator [Xylanimonas allomyrinae]|uniref:TetR/AcrR family transcriptional regulator n=1 Tax=Xylanimonas allomyrinae TaxID=2509459 RepID=A0A4P6ES44_9MICO|nr:helix-turn-helix domain-containing protein [Xylanimonas allomyrinae]QAY64339.1 TetR/AcrR family transcriptional regulator [Xylanimonas allomyrinae]